MLNYFDTLETPLFTANFAYFQQSRPKWELMLTRLTQMGFRAITITIPWGFHQPNPGSIDLTGKSNPRQDIVGLIKLCATLNIRCLLKPGPYYTDDGLLNNGLPNWLPENSDKRLEAIDTWNNAFSRALVDFQWPDGPIIAIMPTLQQEQTTPSQELTEVKWPIWLRKQYTGIDALNTAYNTDYRSVSNVPFPQNWSEPTTPLEKDAHTFIATLEQSRQNSYKQTLVTAGWEVPVYFDQPPTETTMPPFEELAPNNVFQLANPIQISPTPSDAGTMPVWANSAPIRADGWVRKDFWHIRHAIWANIWPKHTLTDGTFEATIENGGVVSSARDTALKVILPKETKPATYLLLLNGKITNADTLKVSRGRLRGDFLTEHNAGQTDVVFYLNDPTEPLNGFVRTYLGTLLTAQIATLSRCAKQASEISHTLTLPPQTTGSPATEHQTPNTVSEAKRGLSKAESALKKAMASIGDLEAGFDTMLGKSSVAPATSAETQVVISPEVFEGIARDILIEAGEGCASIVPALKNTVEDLQATFNAPSGFTVEQYQQSYATAVSAAKNAHNTLLDIIARLRLATASKQLPLVTWRVHQQILALAENLQRGVLRE